jgi:hypothetical protein
VSGDPGSIAGSKEGDRGSDVLGFPDASERIPVAEAIGSALLGLPVSGPDGGWSDSVHSDAIGSQTGRKVDREGTDSAFADEYGSLPKAARALTELTLTIAGLLALRRR